MRALSSVDPLAWLDDRLDRATREGGVPRSAWRQALYGPLCDFLSRPSKGVRAAVLSTSFAAAGGKGAPPVALVRMVELLHAGSLIVDDIEDGAETRRGGPALHVGYGVPTALNAGNWLYFHAMTLLDDLELPAETLLDLHRRVIDTLVRCHDGQALDLSVRVSELSRREVAPVVRRVTELKTGALMSMSALVGARAAGADRVRAERLAAFGLDVGTALQMLDDLGSVCATSRSDKGLEDLVGDRPTWAWAWLSESHDDGAFAELQRRARAVEQTGQGGEALLAEMRAALGDGPRARVHELLTRALSDLARDLGPSEALRQFSREITRLEESYG